MTWGCSSMFNTGQKNQTWLGEKLIHLILTAIKKSSDNNRSKMAF